jgi:hypothetical protein
VFTKMSIERDSARQMWRHIQQNSPFVLFIGLLITAVLLGLAVNYLSNILFEWLWPEGQIGWQVLQAILTLVVIVASAGAGIYLVQEMLTEETVDFDVLLPYVISPSDVTIPYIERYHPTRLAAAPLALAFRREEGSLQRFRASWEASQKDRERRPLTGFALDCTYNIVERLILQYVQRYGQITLGSKAKFALGSDLAEPISGQRRTLAEIAKIVLAENLVFRHDPQSKDWVLHFPCDVEISVEPLPKRGFVAEDEGQPVRRLCLKNERYGELTITPSQIWREPAQFSQTGRVLAKRLELDAGEQLVAALVRVQLKTKFETWRFLWPPWRRKLRTHVLWLMGLVDYLRNHLGWDTFLVIDQERALIRLEEKVDALATDQQSQIAE